MLQFNQNYNLESFVKRHKLDNRTAKKYLNKMWTSNAVHFLYPYNSLSCAIVSLVVDVLGIIAADQNEIRM